MIGVLAIDFGGPRGPEELQPFLARLLADVLPGPAWVKSSLGAAIARRRAPKVAPAYRQIGWSPLVPTHLAQMDALRAELGPDGPPIASGMLFTAPEIGDAVTSLAEQGVDRLIAFTLFPHYSFATASAGFHFLHEALAKSGRSHWPVHRVPAWPDHPGYLEAVGDRIRDAVSSLDGEGPIHLLFSPHGLPVSWVRRGDPYPDQVRLTIRRVVDQLGWTGPWHVGWQSRVGPARWLAPSTLDQLTALGQEGVKRVVVVPVAFASEHIETLHEMDVEMREAASRVGIVHFGRAAAAGMHPAFIRCLADLVRTGVARFGKPTCVRCLGPEPSIHRGAKSCSNCGFRLPVWNRT